ncbi:type II CRISPR RNA-guided endonuclease Cas9 [Clostridium sp.]|uniref:type II CRISPR RNA-guided endonuclease Cas9 n=1 Tax=Clostridium sp. TaxID=1506 RepID=UPI003F302FD5
MKDKINYRLGLDIGIASVGWSVINLEKQRIEDLGVRIFNAAENPKDGASLALPRRLARGKRKLIRRKAYRVGRVKKLIVDTNILTKESLENLFNEPCNIWEIRVKALDKNVSNEEWARILINLAKRRGFKSNRKNEVNDKETGQVITSIKSNIEKMKEIDARTVGELIYKQVTISKDPSKSFRNKNGQYNNCVDRKIIEDEIKLLFKLQREFGARFASEDTEQKYLEIFNSQRPYSNFEDLEKMVGLCTFEKLSGEKRAPKNCISAEEFVLYDNLNKISIINKGDKRKLNADEREVVIKEAFIKKEIKYSSLRKLLKLTDDEIFSTLTYSYKVERSKTENTRFISLKGYHEIRSSIEKILGKSKWKEIKDDKEILNNISYVLSLAKTDEDITKQLEIRNIPKDIIDAVIDISFSKFMNLSIKAIDKMLPFLKEGYQYNQACEKAGYDFKAIFKGEKSYKLPLIDINEIVNPVVNRSLAQTRKVVNAVIDKYGSPVGINIELARDLAKNFKDRKSIEKDQLENRAKREKIVNELETLTGKKPTAQEVIKYRLWNEQKCACAYTQESISFDNLFSTGAYEIDHIIPFSRSFDDSLNNKILVNGVENQRKGNRLPSEYFGNDKDKWHRFEVWVEESNLSQKKKHNLLKVKFSKEDEREFKERNLTDTKYISSYIANFIRNKLMFKDSKSKQKVITLNGRATAYLRAKWGLTKVREAGDKHHALDATVVAVATQGMVQEISKYSKANELKYIRNGDDFIDIETGEVVILEDYKYLLKDKLPRPWLGFSEELTLRLSNNPLEELKKHPIKTYDNEFIKSIVKPIFVSRMPYRKISGKLFKETIYSKKAFKDGKFITKKNLVDLKKTDIENIYNYNSDRKLYDEIIKKFNEHEENAKLAFAEEFRKPTKDGSLGPVVKSIKIETKVPFKDGIDLNNGKVAKDGMVRIDIYEKENKYFSVPVYRNELILGKTPVKAATRNKQEKDWIEMSDDYKFKFSLYKNDLILISYESGKRYLGYYDSFDRSSVSLTIENHDNSERFRGVGIKSEVKEFVKFQVDVLGNYYKVKR